MRILIIGSGGREHALAWKLNQSPLVSHIVVTPSNGGMMAEGFAHACIAADNISALVQLAQEQRIDMVVPGAELPLTLGIVDAMHAVNIPCFGPDAYCAQLEGSKTFAKKIMAEANVPTAIAASFTDYAAARQYIMDMGAPVVIKADGLAAGKGVVVAHTLAEALAALESIMRQRVYGEAGSAVVIEEFLEGEEASFLCFCDGEHASPLPFAQDHKPVFDGDTGPNTGGMGAYSPAPIVPDAQTENMADMVIRPILRVLAQSGHPFKGVLYAGLMVTKDGVKVLEYNTRFGDPECQPLLMRLQSDLAQIMRACIQGQLVHQKITYDARTALGVVLAAQGYPESYPKGMEIHGIPEADALPNIKVFHSGTLLQNGHIVSNGGRVLCITALGDDLEGAQRHAYAALARIRMDKSQFRTDIGQKGIMHLKRATQ